MALSVKRKGATTYAGFSISFIEKILPRKRKAPMEICKTKAWILDVGFGAGHSARSPKLLEKNKGKIKKI